MRLSALMSCHALEVAWKKYKYVNS